MKAKLNKESTFPAQYQPFTGSVVMFVQFSTVCAILPYNWTQYECCATAQALP